MNFITTRRYLVTSTYGQYLKAEGGKYSADGSVDSIFVLVITLKYIFEVKIRLFLASVMTVPKC